MSGSQMMPLSSSSVSTTVWIQLIVRGPSRRRCSGAAADACQDPISWSRILDFNPLPLLYEMIYSYSTMTRFNCGFLFLPSIALTGLESPLLEVSRPPSCATRTLALQVSQMSLTHLTTSRTLSLAASRLLSSVSHSSQSHTTLTSSFSLSWKTVRLWSVPNPASPFVCLDYGSPRTRDGLVAFLDDSFSYGVARVCPPPVYRLELSPDSLQWRPLPAPSLD